MQALFWICEMFFLHLFCEISALSISNFMSEMRKSFNLFPKRLGDNTRHISYHVWQFLENNMQPE